MNLILLHFGVYYFFVFIIATYVPVKVTASTSLPLAYNTDEREMPAMRNKREERKREKVKEREY